MAEPLVCWRCGGALQDFSPPMSRLEQCAKCHAELHVCRMCHSYDTRVTGSCLEDMAEDVREKERANFCDYFKPRPKAYVAHDQSKSQAAKAELNALFGLTPDEAEARMLTEDDPLAEAKAARKKLEALFGSSDDTKSDQ